MVVIRRAMRILGEGMKPLNKYFNGYHQEGEREEGPRKHGWKD